MSKPKVSIGICARNSEKTITDAIDSVICQSYPHELMEIVFVDDGSEDKTLQIMQDYTQKMDIHSKIIHTEWRGLGIARNTIVHNARGDYIFWVDSDEVIEKDYVKKIVDFMDNNPKAGIVLGLTYAPEGNIIVKLDMLPFFIERINVFRQKTAFPKNPGIGGAAFRTEALRQVGGFDENLKGAGEDVEIAFRIKSAGWLINVVDAKFYEKKGGIYTLIGLWRKYFWYGYGNHKVYMKNRKVIEPAKMSPLAGILEGFLYGIQAYKITRERIFMLILPVSFPLNSTAWCLGFTKSHLQMLMKSYSSRRNGSSRN